MRECHQQRAARGRTDSEDVPALLRISKIEVVARQSGFRDINLSELFKTVCDAYSVAAEDQGRTIITNIVPSLRTRGDEELLAEMLANLLDNALGTRPLRRK